MKKKVLILASVASMIDQFNMQNINILQELGYEVHVACNFEKGSTCNKEKIVELKKKLDTLSVKYFQIDFSRNVYNLIEVRKAYIQVKELLIKEKYEFIHCHSPIGGVCGRIAAHKTKTKVIYTAHGFHFFKGAPIINWIVFYPIEKFLAKWTDVLITINKEDYERAKKKFRAGKVEYVPGVGYDEGKVNKNPNVTELRNKFNIPQDATVLLTVGELNKNKNQQIIIEAMSKIENNNIHYLLCGLGNFKVKLEQMAEKLNISERVHFLGFRSELSDIYGLSDIYICPSIREGLNVSIMEAMANGLLCIVSDIRGNRDLVKIEEFLVKGNNADYWSIVIDKFLKSDYYYAGKANKERIKIFSLKNISNKMKKIYCISNL